MLEEIKECRARADTGTLSEDEIFSVMDGILDQTMEAKSVLLVPPDITRYYSYAGKLTHYCYHKLKDRAEVRIMPATGTHRPMTRQEQICFIGADVPGEAYLVHNWQKDTVKTGRIPASWVEKVCEGRCSMDIDVEVNRHLVDGSFDLILSFGQVVPHEVAGMANYSKNILVGLGGPEMINKSHMAGALYGLENIMGSWDSPVRRLMDYGEEHFLNRLPTVYVLTVTAQRGQETDVYGIFAGASRSVFEQAAELSASRNITYLDKPVKKVVAYLEPREYTSAWVGNKAIYRTRMIVEDSGELLILAPGLKSFGENETADRLIRRYGYRGSSYITKLWKEGKFSGFDGVAAHLIHGSSEGRFRITYATVKENMSKAEVESAGYEYMDYKEAVARYPVDSMEDGYCQMPDGEEIYLVKSPALGLWKIK